MEDGRRVSFTYTEGRRVELLSPGGMCCSLGQFFEFLLMEEFGRLLICCNYNNWSTEGRQLSLLSPLPLLA